VIRDQPDTLSTDEMERISQKNRDPGRDPRDCLS
jgi:hypothetical protein